MQGPRVDEQIIAVELPVEKRTFDGGERPRSVPVEHSESRLTSLRR